MDFDHTWSLGESGTLLIFKVKGHQVKFLPCNILVNSRINILQWILTKLGTCLVLGRVWNPIYFQGQRSRSPGQIFRRGDMPHFVLPLLGRICFQNGYGSAILHFFMKVVFCTDSHHPVTHVNTQK